MSLILVIEQDGSYTERIKGALAAEGWTVQVVADRDAAMLAASRSQPDLVLVSTAAPGAVEMMRSFSRAQGGPGALALTAESGAASPASGQRHRAGTTLGAAEGAQQLGGAPAAAVLTTTRSGALRAAAAIAASRSATTCTVQPSAARAPWIRSV